MIRIIKRRILAVNVVQSSVSPTVKIASNRLLHPINQPRDTY